MPAIISGRNPNHMWGHISLDYTQVQIMLKISQMRGLHTHIHYLIDISLIEQGICIINSIYPLFIFVDIFIICNTYNIFSVLHLLLQSFKFFQCLQEFPDAVQSRHWAKVEMIDLYPSTESVRAMVFDLLLFLTAWATFLLEGRLWRFGAILNMLRFGTALEIFAYNHR